MGRMQRNKGATFERKIANTIKAIGVDAKRGIGQARSGSEVADVVVPGWWVECKHHIKPDPLAALRQATKASKGTGLTPVAICKANRSTPTATWTEVVRGVHMVITVDLIDWLAVLRNELEDREHHAQWKMPTHHLGGKADAITLDD